MGSNMKNNTGKMVEILTRLKVEKNGAVVDSMREKGVSYSLSYGVSVPLIREVAEGYFPDHELARFLYRQDIRELKLAALSVAEPGKVESDELGFWAEGIVSSEIAEHFGTVLLSKTDVLDEALGQWLVSDNMLLVYSVLMAAGANMMANKKVAGWDWKESVGVIADPSNDILGSEERYIWHGLSVFFMNLLQRVPDSVRIVKEFLDAAVTGGYPCAEHLEAEIGWLL